MILENIDLITVPLLRLLAVFILGLAVLAFLRRKSPEWRVATVRVTMMAMPIALLLGFSKPALLIPLPQIGSETEGTAVQLPRKGGALSAPWVGASLFPGEEKENEAVTIVETPNVAGAFLRSLTWKGWLLVVWTVGFIIMLSRESMGAMILRRRHSELSYVSSSLLRAWRDVTCELGFDIPENSIMQLSDATVSPYLTPWPYTRLMIPSQLEKRFTGAEIEHLFRHESAHLSGRDPAALFMMRMTACALWFFPGAWWLARKHLNLCEECADTRAARVGGVESYREAIASFALEFVPSKSTRVMALLKKATVVERLKVLSGNVSKSRPSNWQKGVVILVLFSSLAGIGRVGVAEVGEPAVAEVVLPPVDLTSLPGVTTGANSDAPDMWYRGFLIIQKARALEERGVPDVVLMNLYNEALVIYERLASDYPTYLPDIVTERTHLIRDKIISLKVRLKSASGAVDHVSTSALAEPLLKIRGVTGKWNVDDSQGQKITLVVDIVSDTDEGINPALMSLKVMFYELVGGTRLEPSIADIGSRYPSEPYDWKDGEAETIEIDYFLPKYKAESARRGYYGRIVELYYNGILQYVVATPSKLDRLVK